MKRNIISNLVAVPICTLLSLGSIAQAPAVEWRATSWLPELPIVGNISWPPETSVSQGESSNDWWYEITPVYQDGHQIGYAAAGRSSAREEDSYWTFSETGTNNCYTGAYYTRQTIALLDLEGNTIWNFPYNIGLFYGIIQDHEGNLVAVGQVDNVSGQGAHLNGLYGPQASYDLLYNPTSTSNTTHYAYDCSLTVAEKRQFHVMKVDLEGDILWSHVYNSEAAAIDGAPLLGVAEGLIETYVDNEWGYRVVGWTRPGGSIDEPTIVDLDLNGFLPDGLASITTFPDIPGGRLISIQRLPFEQGEQYVLSGHKGLAQAFLMYFDGPGTIPTETVNLWDNSVLNAYMTSEYPGFYSVVNAGFDAALVKENGVTKVIWPVVAEYASPPGAPVIYASLKTAQLHVMKLDLNSGVVLEWETDLGTDGEVTAWDLYASVQVTGDGNFVVSSTRMGPDGPPDPQNDPVFQAFATNCDLAQYNDGVFDWLTPPTDYNANIYNYWNTDAFVAKLRSSDGDVLWSTQFDSGTDFTCSDDPPNNTTPDDWNRKKRECIFDVAETEDMGIVICGNSSHNYDDGYQAKLEGCSGHLVEVVIYPDAYASQTSWAIKTSGGTTVCSGGGYVDGWTLPIMERCCLPDNACYILEVYDSSEDGMCAGGQGGYLLRMNDGRRIIDNAPSGDCSTWETSSVNGATDFCLPLGPLTLDISSCDMDAAGPFNILVAEEDPLVNSTGGTAGYQFQIMDPDGDNSYVRNVTHTVAAPGPVGSCNSLSHAFWNTQFPPHDKLLNVRVKSVNVGVTTNFGPVCRYRFEDCCGSQLIQESNHPDYDQSCDGPPVPLQGTSRLYAYPRGTTNGCSANPSHYRYTLTPTGGGTAKTVTRTTPQTGLTSGWSSALTAGTYNCEVDVKVSGVWNTCGISCPVTLYVPFWNGGGEGGGEVGVDEEGPSPASSDLSIYPNPTDGSGFYVAVSSIGAMFGTGSAQLDVFDAHGLKVLSRTVTVPSDGSMIDVQLDVPLAEGLYMVTLGSGDAMRTRRMVVAGK